MNSLADGEPSSVTNAVLSPGSALPTKKIGKGHVTTIIPMVFSADETTDIGRERLIVMFFHDGPGPGGNVKRIHHERSQRQTSGKISRIAAIVALRLAYRWALACSLPPILVGAAEQEKTESAKPPAPPLAATPAAPATIPLADIATWATAVSNLIGNLTAGAKPSAQIENIAKTLPALSEKLDAQFAATTKSLEAEPTLETLQNEQQLWQSRAVASDRLVERAHAGSHQVTEFVESTR